MSTKKRSKTARQSQAQDDPKQSERFIETAKAADTEESADALERAFDAVVSPKPSARSQD